MGVVFALGLDPPGLAVANYDPFFTPGGDSPAAPMGYRIALSISLSLCFIIPALWIITLQLATFKRGGRLIGSFLFLLAGLVLYEALDVFLDPHEIHPIEWIYGYSVSTSILLIIGGYLTLYSKWIYKINLPNDNLISRNKNKQQKGMAQETRQILARLMIFSIIVAISLVVTIVLSLFPQFKRQPYYLTMGFFGILAAGMLVTGFIKENFVASLIPWSRKNDTLHNHLNASSTEFVGEIWLGKIAKCVI
jgi:hypothetical protein